MSRQSDHFREQAARAERPGTINFERRRYRNDFLRLLRSSGVRLSIGVQIDPVSASNFDPFERRGLAVALASSELAGIAETWRARVV